MPKNVLPNWKVPICCCVALSRILKQVVQATSILNKGTADSRERTVKLEGANLLVRGTVADLERQVSESTSALNKNAVDAKELLPNWKVPI